MVLVEARAGFTGGLGTLPDPWPVLVSAYLAEVHLRGGSIRTPVEYGRILARFFTAYRDPSEVTPIGVHSFAYGRSPGRDLPSASTICVRLAAISSFYAFAQRLEAVGRNPAAEVRRPRATAPLRPTLGDDDLRRLLAAIPDTPSGFRDRAIVVLILLDGLRRSEVLSLRAGDVDFTGGAYVVRVKGGHQRQRQIPPPALQAIVLALNAQGRAVDRLVNRELLFPISGAGFYANLRRYAVDAGLQDVSPHVLRHAAAKLRRRSGASIEAVSAFLGHTNIATTAIYLRRHETELDDGWRDAAIALGVVPETTPAQANPPTSEDTVMSEQRRSAAPESSAELQIDGDEVVEVATGQRHQPVDMAGQITWVSALPGDGMPAHQYAVFGYPPPLPVQVLLTVIKARGYNAYFRGYRHPMRYVELADDMRYWRTVLNRTHMLNRCTLDSVEPPRRVDQGAKRIPWDGPPWAPYGSSWPPGYVEISPGEWVYRSNLDPRRGFECRGCAHRYWLSVPNRPCPRCGTVPRARADI